VDPHPGRKHRRFRPQVIERLETLAVGSPPEILLQTLDRQGPVIIRDLLKTSMLGEAAPDALAQLLDRGQVIPLTGDEKKGAAGKGELVASHEWWTALMERLSDELSSYHEEFPLRKGMPLEALRSRLRLEPKVFDAVLARAAAEGALISEGAAAQLASHTIQLTPKQEEQVDALLSRFRREPYAPPSVKESKEAVGTEVLNMLLLQGTLVQVSPAVLFLSETYEEMVRRIKLHIEREGSISLAQTRDRFDSSRKYAQAILEHLDAIGVTKRVGDERVLRET